MNNQGMRARKQIISILILILLISITFFFFLRGYSLDELKNALRTANYAYLFGGLCLMFVFVGCEAFNIRMILKTLGNRVPYRRCLEYSSLGFYFSSITPSAGGGQPLQIYYMKRDRIPIEVSSITIFFIVFVYQIAMILLGIIMTLFRFSEAVYFMHQMKYLFIFGFIANTGGIFFFFALMFSKRLVPAVMNFILKAGVKFKLIKKADTIRDRLNQSLISYREKAMLIKEHTGLFFKVLFVSFIQMVSFNLIPSLVYCSMGNDIRNIPDLLTGHSIITISVSAVPLPGAEGVTQGGFLRVYDNFFPPNMLPYAMLIHRIVSFYIPLLISFMIYLYTHIRTTKQSIRGDIFDGK